MKLRVGVVGIGIGNKHIIEFGQHPECKVVAVCDKDSARLQAIADELDVPERYLSYEEMLAKANLDIMGIATPNKCHHDMTVMAFDAGCHVLCEKPPAMNTAGTKEMIAASEKAGKRLMFDFSFRFNHASDAARQHVDSAALGDVYFGRAIWHRQRGVPWWYDRDGSGMRELTGGGPVVDLGVHRMDLALWLMDYPTPTWVMGATYDKLGRKRCRTRKEESRCRGYGQRPGSF